ncbi:MAG: branched-chain amino acid ABC transporter permease [Herminiimonas sp.]|nr:branched-chain amino acid ABC transporter permease [Herminiimonas sp.]
MSTFLQYVLSGISIGAIYSLVALGFYIMWSACKAVNFAHGDVLMVGAVLAVVCNDVGVPQVIAIPVAIGICVGYGMLIERFAVRPFNRESNAIGWMLTTIAIGIMIESFATIKFGSFARALPSPGVDRPISVFGAGIYVQELVIPVFVLVFVIGLEIFYRRTMLGRAMRAVAFNRTAAGMMGINVGRVTAFSFGLAAGLGGAAGILIGPIIQVSSTMGVLIGLKGFAVAIMASITSARGVVITGLLYGVLEKFVEGYISSAAREVVGFSVMILILLACPQGLFGRKEFTKV